MLATAKLLEDGHVEFIHNCVDGEVICILNNRDWKVITEFPLSVEPSVNCNKCGLHGFIGDPKYT